MATEERIPIILDTDIGSDIDDALCLSYLLGQPRCELVGVTTVSGEPERRAMLADALCQAAGRMDVPIHSGAGNALLIPQRQRKASQYGAISAFPHRTDFAPNTAIEFMRQSIHSRPGEVTLLAIGPLTNVALLFATDPEIPQLLKSLVLMGGAFKSFRKAEWNILVDPHAAAVVYQSPVAQHLSIGLDVTTQCRMSADEARRRLRGGPLDVAAAMAEVWFQRSPEVTFHDPLASAVIFEPEICQYEEGKVDVELVSQRVLGMTHWDTKAEEKPHRIALGVDPDRFFDNYFAITTG